MQFLKKNKPCNNVESKSTQLKVKNLELNFKRYSAMINYISEDLHKKSTSTFIVIPVLAVIIVFGAVIYSTSLSLDDQKVYLSFLTFFISSLILAIYKLLTTFLDYRNKLLDTRISFINKLIDIDAELVFLKSEVSDTRKDDINKLTNSLTDY